jgi:two-component system cell cycle response regulator
VGEMTSIDTNQDIAPADCDDGEATTQIVKLDLPVAPTVLIVDDDDLVLARLQELVTAGGYEVRTAASAIEALASLEQSPASIVITDLNMPGMDGLELCRQIRAHTWPGYIYVVLLTVRDTEKDILAGLDAGADDYLSKRTSAAQFTARLRIARRVLGLEYSLKDALEKKRRLSMTDALTGAFNRRYLMRHLNRELKRSQRFGGDVSLLVLDIDHFKRVNDAHGHAVGDAVLKMLTKQVGACLRRDTDWCARLGGEEFVVVLEGTNAAAARTCAEKLRKTVANCSMATSAGPIRITVSIGVSSLGETGNRNSATVQSLMKQADTNLYTSKANGRNRITSTNPLTVAPGIHGRGKQRAGPEFTQDSVGSLR